MSEQYHVIVGDGTDIWDWYNTEIDWLKVESELKNGNEVAIYTGGCETELRACASKVTELEQIYGRRFSIMN